MILVLVNQTAVSLILNYLQISLMATFTLDEREKIMTVVAPSGEGHHLVCKVCFICVFIHTIETSITSLSCFIAVPLFPQLCTLNAHDKVKILGHVMSAGDSSTTFEE